MNLELNGKRALVTGSTSGIGEAIAKSLAAEGAHVVIHGRSEKSAQRVVQEVTTLGGSASYALGDLTNDQAVVKIYDQAVKTAEGKIDILVNNAGHYLQKSWLDTETQEWADLYNLNVLSMVRTIRSFVPSMKQRKWGRVILIASSLGTMPLFDMPAHSASKAAVINLGVSLAKDLVGSGITVNTISPGLILTPGLEKMFREKASEFGLKPEQLEEIEKRILPTLMPNLMERAGRPYEIADMVSFLASPRASFIQGTNIRIDGGTIPTVN